MTGFRLKVMLVGILVVAVCSARVFSQHAGMGSEQDRVSVAKTGDAIRAGFAAGDVNAIMKFHHKDVEKWLAPGQHLVGRDALRAELAKTFESVGLVFEENRVESTLFDGDTAVEVSAFTIRVTPKDGSASSEVKGRAMVVYVRSSQSPTGWVSMRELIQPFT